MKTEYLTTVMTTAPREQETLKKSLESVARAGLPNPYVFAEPGSSPLPTSAYVQYHHKQGVWRNWLNAARFGAYSGSEYVLTLQDDIDLHPDTFQLITELTPFQSHVGCVSLYTSPMYGNDPGIKKVRSSGFWGSLALLFETEVLKDVVNHPLCERWKGIYPADNPEDIIDDDQAIAKILRALSKNLFIVIPSPVKHMGITSSIRKQHANVPRPIHYPADFDKPLLEQIPLSDFQSITITQEETPSWLKNTRPDLQS